MIDRYDPTTHIRLTRKKLFPIVYTKEMSKVEFRTYYRVLKLLRREFGLEFNDYLPPAIGLKIITLFRLLKIDEQAQKGKEPSPEDNQ